MNRIDICKNIIQSLVGHEAYAPMPLFKTVRALLTHTAFHSIFSYLPIKQTNLKCLVQVAEMFSEAHYRRYQTCNSFSDSSGSTI